MNIDFNPETHEYFIDGVKVWSVTQILDANGISDFSFVKPEILEAARDLGNNVHSTVKLFSNNDLDEDSLDPVLALYLEQWKRFLKETKFEVIDTEQIVSHIKFLYCGRYDVRGIFKDKLTLLDIKTGSHTKETVKYTGVQTAGYAMAYNEKKKAKDMAKQRMGVWLTEDSYKMELCTNKADFTVFRAALTMANFKNGGL